MKIIKYDPKPVPDSLPKLTQDQLDEFIREAKGQHAVEKLIEDTPGWQTYLLDDGSNIQVFKYTGTVLVVL
jgi:hypothetical protein